MEGASGRPTCVATTHPPAGVDPLTSPEVALHPGRLHPWRGASRKEEKSRRRRVDGEDFIHSSFI